MHQSLGTNGEIEYKFLKFLAYYKTAKFTWDQSDWLGKQELGDLNKQTNFAYCSERHTSFSVVVEEGRVCTTPNLGQTYRLNYITRN